MQYSNSSVDTFKTCGKKYYYHYIERLRSKYIQSPLLFGHAIDSALNVLLLSKKSTLTEEEKSLVNCSTSKEFEKHFSSLENNGQTVQTYHSPLVQYFLKDLDLKIIEESDAHIADVPFDELEDFKNECSTSLKYTGAIDESLVDVFNQLCWLSLRRKGLYLLKNYEQYILPQIQEVICVQREAFLDGDSGDRIKSIIDFKAILHADGVERVLDNKTASRPYPKNSIETSQQLALYSEQESNRNVGFIVMCKEIKKKPEKQIQIITGKISDEQAQQVFDDIGAAIYAIRNEEFDENWNSCFTYNRKCQFYNLCRDGSREGLYEV